MTRTLVPGRARLVALALASALALTACGGGSAGPASPDAAPTAPAPATEATVLAPPTVAPGGLVSAPADTAVLTLTGKIAPTDGAPALRLDAATLDGLGVLQLGVYEPWVKQTLEYRGVWLADLLRVARVDETAESLHMTALDDYQVDLTMQEVRAGGILLATRTGSGEPIPVEDGGPTRIVFVNGVPSGSSADQWIWSLATIDVR